MYLECLDYETELRFWYSCGKSSGMNWTWRWGFYRRIENLWSWQSCPLCLNYSSASSPESATYSSKENKSSLSLVCLNILDGRDGHVPNACRTLSKMPNAVPVILWDFASSHAVGSSARLDVVCLTQQTARTSFSLSSESMCSTAGWLRGPFGPEHFELWQLTCIKKHMCVTVHWNKYSLILQGLQDLIVYSAHFLSSCNFPEMGWAHWQIQGWCWQARLCNLQNPPSMCIQQGLRYSRNQGWDELGWPESFPHLQALATERWELAMCRILKVLPSLFCP